MGQWLERYRLEKRRHLKSEPLIQWVEPETWLAGWKMLVQLTQVLEKTDDRFTPIMAAVDQCDLANKRRDLPAFQRGVEQVGWLCAKEPALDEAKKRPKEEPRVQIGNG